MFHKTRHVIGCRNDRNSFSEAFVIVALGILVGGNRLIIRRHEFIDYAGNCLVARLFSSYSRIARLDLDI